MKNVKPLLIISIIVLGAISKTACQHLFFNAATGISSLHAQQIKSTFEPRINYALGLNFEGSKKIGTCWGIIFENKGAKNKFNNWNIILNYLTGSIGLTYNIRSRFSASIGVYSSVLVSKYISSNDAQQSSDINTFWKKYDAGPWIEGTRQTKLSFNINKDEKMKLLVFFKAQYGLVNTIERYYGFLSSQGDWIRNTTIYLGIKLKI